MHNRQDGGPDSSTGGGQAEDAVKSNAVVEQPGGPDFLRICPSCNRWFVLKYHRSAPHHIFRQIHYYRCRKCNYEVGYAEFLPPHML